MDALPNWVYALIGKALNDFMSEERCEELRERFFSKLEALVASTDIPLDDAGLEVVKRLAAYKK